MKASESKDNHEFSSASLRQATELLYRGATGLSVPQDHMTERYREFARGVRMIVSAATAQAINQTRPVKKSSP